MDMEQYILLVLADGNLPTGSFVASSGLESYVKHGFFSNVYSARARGNPEKVTDFVRQSLESYSQSTIPFVTDAHIATSGIVGQEIMHTSTDDHLKKLTKLDALYDAMTLNHVARRASKAQGIALLTLLSKGFSPPAFMLPGSTLPAISAPINDLVTEMKLKIRREETYGHLPICWGILTAALGLSLERSQYLHLFLHARSLLSAAIRMNIIGPYVSQQLLLHAVRLLVQAQLSKCTNPKTGVPLLAGSADGADIEGNIQLNVDGPANTWPLGEILAARHDLQHSRIFNS